MLLNLLGTVIVHIILLGLHTEILLGAENPAAVGRRVLLEGAGGRRRATYLYSESDQMVDWRDISEHAEEARGKGWEVEEIRFVGSGHCGHLVRDQEVYSRAVDRMWVGDEAEKEREGSGAEL